MSDAAHTALVPLRTDLERLGYTVVPHGEEQCLLAALGVGFVMR